MQETYCVMFNTRELADGMCLVNIWLSFLCFQSSLLSRLNLSNTGWQVFKSPILVTFLKVVRNLQMQSVTESIPAGVDQAG